MKIIVKAPGYVRYPGARGPGFVKYLILIIISFPPQDLPLGGSPPGTRYWPKLRGIVPY